MKSREPRPVADLLTGAIPQLSERLVEYRILRAWESVVGREAARRARPETLNNGCLHVVVDNSPWLQELTMRAGELTERLSQRFPEVRTLRLVLGTLPATTPASKMHREQRPLRLTSDDVREIDETVAEIPDPALAASARRLLVKAWQFSSGRGTAR